MKRFLAVLLAILVIATAGGARADFNPFSGYYENTARAAKANDAARVRELAADNPNQTDEQDRTGMHYAAMNGNLQIIAILIKAGADIDPRDRLGNTPLMLAAQRNQTEAADLLIEAGAKLNMQNRDGLTPLMIAAGRGNIALVRALLDSGADPHKTDFTGRDAIGWAQESHRQGVVEAIRQALHGHRS